MPAKRFIQKCLLFPALILTCLISHAQIPVEQDPEQMRILPSDTLQPAAQPVAGSMNLLESRVDYQAIDSIFFDIRRQRLYLYGQADIKYENIHLEAAYIEIDFRKNELMARGAVDSTGVMSGFPVFTEDMQSFTARELRYNFETKRGRTVGVVTEQAEGFVHGQVVKIQPNRHIHIQDGKYTTCEDPEPHFHIGFRKAKLIPNDKIITSVAFLVIEDVPMPLFLPFGFFPNKRGQANGILMPSYGEYQNRGFYLENGGFYWGINDYIDLAITGDVFSRGSWALRAASTYRVRYKYNGNFSLMYAINVEGDRRLPTYSRVRDFRLTWLHNQDPKARPNSRFSANVNAGSSQSTRFNPRSEEDYLSNTFGSSISYMASWGGRYNFSASARHDQNTLTGAVNLSLPDISFSVNRFNPFRGLRSGSRPRWWEDISVNYSMQARNQINTVDSLLFDPAILERMRNGISHNIPISHSMNVLKYFNLSSNISYSEKWYFQTFDRNWDPDMIRIVRNDTIYGGVRIDTIPGFKAAREFSFSAGLSTRIYGSRQFRSGPVKAIRHVINPSLSFSYRPDFSAPAWNYFKSYYNPERKEEVMYSVFEGTLFGGPQANRSGNLAFNIGNNLEMKVRNRKDSIAGERKISLIDNFSISGGYDLTRDSLRLSDIRLSGRTRLFGQFDIAYSGAFTLYDRDSTGSYVNRFIWEAGKKPFQLNNTTWSLSLNYSLGSKEQRSAGPGGMQAQGAPGLPPGPGMQGPEEGLGNGQTEMMPGVYAQPVDFSVPWSLSFSYSFTYTSNYRHFLQQQGIRDGEPLPPELIRRFDRSYIQTLSVNGNLSLSPKWRVGVRTGYDFEAKDITYTSVNIYRDLHCWEMTLNWIPFGFRKSYMFTIRAKSSVLQDLKLTRGTHPLDRVFR